MRFEWDESKNRRNQAKHGISFDTAALVFSDPLHVSVQERIEDGELRWRTTGTLDGTVLLSVGHTYSDDEEEVIRIITARKPTPTERNRYEEAHR